MVMGINASNFDKFVDKYKGSEIDCFVYGLIKDKDTVINGITQKQSSGFVDGKKCKEKLVLRIMEGRASTETLKRIFYVASAICKNKDLKIEDLLQLKNKRYRMTGDLSCFIINSITRLCIKIGVSQTLRKSLTKSMCLQFSE